MDAVEQKTVDTVKALVQTALNQIGEHAEFVHIFVGFNDGMSFEQGTGSFYARVGMVKEWVVFQDEFSRCFARRRDEENQE